MTTIPSSRSTVVSALIWLVIGVMLTAVFWGDLWRGGGLIGGDIYSYFLPQKSFYAERLAAGELPLWNNRAGHGYPLVGERQTGALYPFNLLFYRVLGVNAAYNTVQLTHYALAFLFAWLYARRLGLSAASAALTALIYTYGWFPPRITLEWAVVGGAWLPAALWAAESLLVARRWRYALLLSLFLGLQMLPGHYNIAFITQLTIAAYVPLRLFLRNSDPQATAEPRRKRLMLLTAVAFVAAFGLAAFQLLPTWELKQHSQRAVAGSDEKFDPANRHMPAWYLSQVAMPWFWYPYADVDLNRGQPEGAPTTNRVEAHLYFGMVPFLLLLYGLLSQQFFRDRKLLIWLLLVVAALVYMPGWLVPITRHLPGFSFFEGPARYGIVVTFGAALLAGAVWDRMLATRRPGWRIALTAFVFSLTVADFWVVSRLVTVGIILPQPTIEQLPKSPIRRLLADHDGPVRLFSRGANLPTLLGVASTPPYLGIGPAAYFDPQTAMSQPLPFDEPPTPQQLLWLRKAGVTHILSFSLLDEDVWPVVPTWRGYDPFLHRAWGRNPSEPLYLYELIAGRGRITWAPSQSAESTARVVEYRANRVVVEAVSETGGLLILTDLAYPGWTVDVNGKTAEAIVVDEMYRGVRLPRGNQTVVWRYRPRSFFIGGIISIGTVVLLVVIALIRRRKNRHMRE